MCLGFWLPQKPRHFFRYTKRTAFSCFRVLRIVILSNLGFFKSWFCLFWLFKSRFCWIGVLEIPSLSIHGFMESGFCGFGFHQIKVLPNRGFVKSGFSNHGFAKSRFCQPGFSKSSFSKILVFMRGHLALPNGLRDLPNLFCPYKTDSAWANRHSRSAMHFADRVLSNLGFVKSGFAGSRFCGFAFFKSRFCEIGFYRI